MGQHALKAARRRFPAVMRQLRTDDQGLFLFGSAAAR